MKIYIFRGDLIDVSTKKEALLLSHINTILRGHRGAVLTLLAPGVCISEAFFKIKFINFWMLWMNIFFDSKNKWFSR